MGEPKRNPTLSVPVKSCRGRIYATRFGDGLRFIGAPTLGNIREANSFRVSKRGGQENGKEEECT